MDNSKINSELKKLKPLLTVIWLILEEIRYQKYVPSFRYNTNLRQIFLTWTIGKGLWVSVLSVFACYLHIIHMPTQNITSQLPLQVSYSKKRKQTIVRVREARNEEQQLCMDSTVCLSLALGQGPTRTWLSPPHPPTLTLVAGTPPGA